VPTSSPVALLGRATRVPRAWLSPDIDRTGRAVERGAVLVVDDDRGVRRLTSRMLRADGYRVVEAGSGAEALQVLAGDPGIAVLVTDIVMPEMHGLELADRATAAQPHLKVVLMTGHAPELTMQLELRDLSLPVLLKPFSSEQLLDKVKDALGRPEH
jgi:DNA-binding NtrC family response regulator